MLELEQLIDLAVTEAELELGMPAPIVASRTGLAARELIVQQRQIGRRRGAPNLNRWTEDEIAFLRANLGRISLGAIGRALGRSANAIKIKQTRLGIAAASKRPEELTALRAARLLGVDVKLVTRLIGMGELPGRRLPMRRKIWVLRRLDLLRWMLRPSSWIYFRRERVADARIRAYLEHRAARWGDEWLSTGQAAQFLGMKADGKSMLQRIYRGQLRAVRWQNWQVLRSDLERIRTAPGKGSRGLCRLGWGEEAHAFLVLAVAVGLRSRSLAALMGGPPYRAEWRMRMLVRDRAVGKLIDRHELVGVEYCPGRREMAPWLVWADWHDYRRRFPTIERAARKLRSGERLSAPELHVARDLLVTWGRWHGRGMDDAVRLVRAAETMGIERPGAERRLRRIWAGLRALGINPFTARRVHDG